MNHKLPLILLLSALSVIFIAQNIVVVEIRFLFWSIEMSRSLLMLLLLVIGTLIGWFLHSFSASRTGKDT